MPHRSRSVATALAAASVLAVGLLSGCGAGSPTDADRAAWTKWGDDLLAKADGGAGGAMSGDASGEGVRMDFTAPQAFRSVALRCIGTDRAEFTLRYSGTGGDLTTTQEVVCHDGGPLTPIAIPTKVGELTSFAAIAVSPDGEGYWVAIPQP